MWPDQGNLTSWVTLSGKTHGQGNPEQALVLTHRSLACAETVRSPPKPERHGEETVQPTNAFGRRLKPKWDETVGRKFESCRGYPGEARCNNLQRASSFPLGPEDPELRTAGKPFRWNMASSHLLRRLGR